MDKVAGQCPQTTTFLKRRERRSVSNRGPSAYQLNALPLGQTGRMKYSDALIVPSLKAACGCRTEGWWGEGKKPYTAYHRQVTNRGQFRMTRRTHSDLNLTTDTWTEAASLGFPRSNCMTTRYLQSFSWYACLPNSNDHSDTQSTN